jgi:hypothetical protein
VIVAREAAIDGRDADDVLREVAAAVPVPAEPGDDEPPVA